MQLVDPRENTTKDKIRRFSDFQKGWHFGDGVPPSKKTIKDAVGLSDRIAMAGFKSDAFPGIDGEIMVTVYHGEDYLEFTFEIDGTITFAMEKDEKEIAYEENLTVGQAKKRLEVFGTEKKWKNLSGLSIVHIMTPLGKASRALLLETLQDQEFQLFSSHASISMGESFAPTCVSIMKESHQTQSSSGQSGMEFYLMDVVSNSIQVNPVMTATAT